MLALLILIGLFIFLVWLVNYWEKKAEKDAVKKLGLDDTESFYDYPQANVVSQMKKAKEEIDDGEWDYQP